MNTYIIELNQDGWKSLQERISAKFPDNVAAKLFADWDQTATRWLEIPGRWTRSGNPETWEPSAGEGRVIEIQDGDSVEIFETVWDWEPGIGFMPV